MLAAKDKHVPLSVLANELKGWDNIRQEFMKLKAPVSAGKVLKTFVEELDISYVVLLGLNYTEVEYSLPSLDSRLAEHIGKAVNMDRDGALRQTISSRLGDFVIPAVEGDTPLIELFQLDVDVRSSMADFGDDTLRPSFVDLLAPPK